MSDLKLGQATTAEYQAIPPPRGVRNSATRVVTSCFGVLAGLLGLEHGFYEMLQGQGTPGSSIISAISSPCQPKTAWHACEPALTMLPTFFVAGVLTMIVALIVLLWAAAFVHQKHGGLVLLLLSLVLLLVGGGFIPPMLGMIAGLVGTRINASLTWWRTHLSGHAGRLFATGWPWSLSAFVFWEVSEWIVGSFFNAFMLSLALFPLFCTLGLLLLVILTGFAHDTQRQTHAQQVPSGSG